MNGNYTDFENAKVKHLLFKSKVRAIVYGIPVDESGIISENQCELGKWIHDFALSHPSNIPEISELEKVHKEIHEIARKLLTLYKSNRVEEARIGLNEIEKVATKLLSLLNAIENKIQPEPSGNSTKKESLISINELLELINLSTELDKIIKRQSGEILYERRLLREIFLQLPASVAIVEGPNHVFEMVNQAFLDVVGKRDLIGKNVKEAFPELEGQGYFELLDHVFSTGESFIQKESRATIGSGDTLKIIYADQLYKPFKNIDGTIEGILCFGIDVTEQVTARKKLEQEAETTRFITESMPQKVWTGDSKGNIDYMNQQWMDFTGRTFDELKSWGWKSIIHPDDLQENLNRWNESIKTGNDFEFEHRFRDKNGDYRWHLSRARAQKGTHGEVIRWVGTNTDIHDLKLLQTKLQESYEDLETKVKFRNLQLEKEIENLRRKNA